MIVLPKEAYCMNLAHRKDRWEHMIKDFARLQRVMHVSLVKVPAVSIPSRPQTGTSETVHKIIRNAKEKGLEYVLILEDDLHIIDPDYVVKALKNTPADWDLLSGGVYHYSPDTKYNEYWMQVKDYCSMHFVIIHSRIYDKVLGISCLGQHIDRTIGGFARKKQIKAFVMHPMPCQQISGYSDIRKRAVNDNLRKLPWIQNPGTLK